MQRMHRILLINARPIELHLPQCHCRAIGSDIQLLAVAYALYVDTLAADVGVPVR